VLHAESVVGKSYLIDVDCVNGGVPYCNHFSTVLRYCIKSVAADLTRLTVTGRIHYHKSVWAFMKSTSIPLLDSLNSLSCPYQPHDAL